MKRIISLIIVLFLGLLIYEAGVLFFIKQYKYTYNIEKNKHIYKVNENYNYINKQHVYDIEIYDENKNKYLFNINYNFHKDKEIIDELLAYKESTLTCLLPVFRDDVVVNISCYDEKEKSTFAYDYLNQKNDDRLKKIKDKIYNDGYKLNAWTTNTNTKTIKGTATKITYYTNFIPNYNVIVWNYKGVFSINSKTQEVNEFLNGDVYDSKYLTKTSNKMYAMNAFEGEVSFDKIYSINISDGKMKIIDVLDETVSTNSYFNGVYNSGIYFMDCNSNKQYKIDENKQKLEVVSKENKIKYYDGENLIDKTVANISNSNIVFSKTVINKTITKLYHTVDIRKSNHNYYFKTDDGNIHMCHENDINNSIILFNTSSFSEWDVVFDTVFGISGDTLFAYNMNYGLKPLAIYNEFNYHTDNMYAVIRIN